MVLAVNLSCSNTCSGVHREGVLKGVILEFTVLRPGCQGYSEASEETFNPLPVCVCPCTCKHAKVMQIYSFILKNPTYAVPSI